jgi:hypothetical protein
VTGPAASGSTPPREQVVLTRLRGQPGPGFRVILVLLAVGLALAALKPWGATGPSEASSPPGVAMASVSPTSSGGSTPAIGAPAAGQTFDPERSACEAGVGWRAFALVHDLGFKSRMWIAIEPAPASGPADSTIPTVPLGADRVAVLGYCTDFRSHPKRKVVLGGVWRVDASGATQLALDVAAEFSPDDAAMGFVLNPPAPAKASPSGPPSWQPGHYVFALELQEAGRTDETWFGVQVLARCPPSGSPAPTPRAQPSTRQRTPQPSTSC